METTAPGPSLSRIRQRQPLAIPDVRGIVRLVALVVGVGLLAVGAVTNGLLMLAGVVAILVGVTISRTQLEPASIVVALLAVTLLIPSRLVVPQIGATGTPALLLGLVLLAVWVLSRLLTVLDAPHGRHPLRVACALILLSAMASYVWSFLHRFDGFSVTALDRGLLVWASFVGIALFTADSGITREQAVRVIDAAIVMVTIVAAIGIMQALLRIDPVQYIRIPGLRPSVEIGSIRDRFGVVRVTSTAKHPIEFSVIVACCVPLAIARSTTRWRETGSLVWPATVLVMLLSLATAVSRSGILALGAAFLVFLPTMTRGQRRALLYSLPVVLVVGRTAFPGVIGTLRGLFLNFGTDNSVSSRISDYGAVEVYVAESPILGRGMRTFDAERFLLLDNQILLTLIEMGVIGVAVISIFFVTAIGLARGVRIRARDEDEDLSRLGQAIVAGLIALAFSFGTFDATHYSMVMNMTAVLAGLACTLWLSTGGYRYKTPLSGWALRVRTAVARARVAG